MSATAAGWAPEDLIYCSNVHPGESLEQVCTIAREFVAPVARMRGLARAGAGLWLSRAAAAALVAEPAVMACFSEELTEAGVRLFTLNGFPAGGFHERIVKEQVYEPDWSAPERYHYTVALARILAECLPADVAEGTISTLPLGFAPGWSDARQAAARSQVVRLAEALRRLHLETGRAIRLCLEMEPGCVLESTAQVLQFFSGELPQAARAVGVPDAAIERHLGLCFDVCHQAVMFEDPAASLASFRDAGIAVGKIQVSSALVATDPADAEVRQALRGFAEPRYLHQVRCRGHGALRGAMDLADCLDDHHALPRDVPWRIHFHVPVQTRVLAVEGLATTQDEIAAVLDFLAAEPALRPHLEVETYTWQVLPEALRPADDAQLLQGVVAELNWLEQALRARGLLGAHAFAPGAPMSSGGVGS